MLARLWTFMTNKMTKTKPCLLQAIIVQEKIVNPDEEKKVASGAVGGKSRSNVTTVYKNVDVTPIYYSTLSAIATVFEKIKYDLVNIHSSFNMFGFLCGHSCCSSLLHLCDDW